MTAALEVGEWSAARPGRTLPPGKTRYPFYRRLCGPQGWSGRAENLFPTGIRSRTVQPRSQLLYWLSYRAHIYICFSFLEFGCDISSYRVTCLSQFFFKLYAAFGINCLSVRDYHREKPTALLNTVNQGFSNRVPQMAVWGFRERRKCVKAEEFYRRS